VPFTDKIRIAVLKETLAYYSKNNSTVFCTFLDATKAFDRVKYYKLFRLLIDRGLPAGIIRLLLNVYTSNFVRVAWCEVLSDYFVAINGVKQGGVLSPVLFCIYLDNLLERLSRSGVGCFMVKLLLVPSHTPMTLCLSLQVHLLCANFYVFVTYTLQNTVFRSMPISLSASAWTIQSGHLFCQNWGAQKIKLTQ